MYQAGVGPVYVGLYKVDVQLPDPLPPSPEVRLGPGAYLALQGRFCRRSTPHVAELLPALPEARTYARTKIPALCRQIPGIVAAITRHDISKLGGHSNLAVHFR